MLGLLVGVGNEHPGSPRRASYSELKAINRRCKFSTRTGAARLPLLASKPRGRSECSTR